MKRIVCGVVLSLGLVALATTGCHRLHHRIHDHHHEHDEHHGGGKHPPHPPGHGGDHPPGHEKHRH